MKKSILNLLLASGMISSALTQENSITRSFVGITSGYSGLSGKITQSYYADNRSGYAASSGFNLGIDGAWMFLPHLGIGGMCSNGSFATNGLQSLADGYKEDFDVDSTTVKVSGRYQLNNLLAGPYFSFPMQRFTFDFRVLAGVSFVKTPQFTTYLEDQQNATFSQSSATGVAFAFQAGAGVRYALTNWLAVRLNVDYFRSNPDLTITNVNRTNNAGRLVTDYHQPFSVVNGNLGIAWTFGKR